MNLKKKTLLLIGGLLIGSSSTVTVAKTNEYIKNITWYSGTGQLVIESTFSCADPYTIFEAHTVRSNGDWNSDNDYIYDFLFHGTDGSWYPGSPYKHTLNTEDLHYDDGTATPMGLIFRTERPYDAITFRAQQVRIPSWPDNSNWNLGYGYGFDLKCNEMGVTKPPVILPPNDECRSGYECR